MNIGVDVEEISRFSKMNYKEHLNFYKKIFSHDEIEYCLQKADPYPHFAVRFCAKEAAIKAFTNHKLSLKDSEVIIKNQKPSLKVLGKYDAKVSLSHSPSTAIAVVLNLDYF